MRCVFNSPFPRQCAAALDVPRVRRDGVERETLGDLRRRHGTFHILFIGQNENGRLLKVLRRKPENTPVTKRKQKKKPESPSPTQKCTLGENTRQRADSVKSNFLFCHECPSYDRHV